jgi:hypothetical protein
MGSEKAGRMNTEFLRRSPILARLSDNDLASLMLPVCYAEAIAWQLQR